MAAGWQQKPEFAGCMHLGLMSAVLTIARHKEGHEWVCTCGKKYVVVSDGGKNKKLVPRS